MQAIIPTLCRLRWNVDILAELYHREGARFVILAKKLGISRSVLRSTLQQLISDGLVAPNPGYGHPLRPEYILTHAGSKVAPFCRELVSSAKTRREESLLQSKWSLPVLFAIGTGEARFSELKNRLAPITSRALSEELKTLAKMGHVRRKIVEEFPPVPIYLLNPKARRYAAIYEKHMRALSSLPDGRR